MFEAASLVALQSEFMDEDNTLAFVKQQLNLDPKVHKVSFTSPRTFKVDFKLKQLKQTSFIFTIELKDETTEDILGENIIKMVRIDRKTRRLSLFPEWFYKKYAAFMNTPGHPGTEKEDLPEIPKNAVKYDVIPGHSDEDYNGHVNQSSYLRF
ncbi:uncharacterized protein LOC134274759 [Saccostrea cucullata]|uniref:uncharacterized protein LOC134274759 n=1 Tax=Saccostrea cuccullata TaxID=36930 RepID=UPI002ED6842B